MNDMNWVAKAIALALGLHLSACIQPVAVPPVSTEAPFVLYCLLQPDELIRVQLSQGTATTDQDSNWTWVSTAQVQVFEGGSLRETLRYTEEGWYEGSSRPVPGESYRIEAQVAGQPLIWGSDTVPEYVPVDSAWYRFTALEDQDGNPLLEYRLYVRDRMGDHFYEAAPYELQFGERVPQYPFEFPQVDPVILTEGHLNPFTLQSRLLVFSDRVFAGKSYGLSLWRSGPSDPDNFVPDPNQAPFAGLRNLSRHLYFFRKSLDQHLANQAVNVVYLREDTGLEIDLEALLQLGEPQELYSNVQGGLGIVAAYTESRRGYRFRR